MKLSSDDFSYFKRSEAMETQSVSIAERSDEASVSRHVSRRDKVKIVKVYSGRIHQEIFTNLPASRQGCSQNRRKRAEQSFVIQGIPYVA